MKKKRKKKKKKVRESLRGKVEHLPFPNQDIRRPSAVVVVVVVVMTRLSTAPNTVAAASEALVIPHTQPLYQFGHLVQVKIPADPVVGSISDIYPTKPKSVAHSSKRPGTCLYPPKSNRPPHQLFTDVYFDR